jgi:hypothetical protein
VFINNLDVQAELVTVQKVRGRYEAGLDCAKHPRQGSLKREPKQDDRMGKIMGNVLYIKKCMVMYYGQRNQENNYHMDGESRSYKKGGGHWSTGVKQPESRSPVCQGSTDGKHCARAAVRSLSF